MYFPGYKKQWYIHVAIEAKDPGLFDEVTGTSWLPSDRQGEASLLTVGAFEEMI